VEGTVTRGTPFGSFFLGGFECSTHRRADGVRLDVLRATEHDRRAAADYRQLRENGILAARDGLRWHLIEKMPGTYDWSSFFPMLEAANATGTQVIWDLCHYGWPDHLDIFAPAFVESFAAFAAAAADIVRTGSEATPFYCPVNEISYWSWAGGEVGQMNPRAIGSGGHLKRQLVRATVAAVDAIRRVDPRARFITAEPLIHVTSGRSDPFDVFEAERYRLFQFEATDLLCGRLEPELGGRPDLLDIVGVNYYPENQWRLGGPTVPLGHHAYRPLAEMLVEVHRRYGRPILLAETGAEGSARSAWLHYVAAEVREALGRGVPVEGICLYPVLDYPGWENGRTCDVGLLGAVEGSGARRVCRRTALELRDQERRVQQFLSPRTLEAAS
jgi:beta-glucosidase/6-phospho-beta-glucosidase/beta-galactosidase